jgi:aerobic-type carbon monoxide dehydrogenase small subunit (CoxS/CutS family)
MDPVSSARVSVEVNGARYEAEVEARRLLVHLLRDDLDLTGTHIGCDTGNCGACSVIVDGQLVKSCMLLAVQADGSSIETVEGLAEGDELSTLQQAFSARHALQCGYCTPGMLMSATALLRANPEPTEGEVQKALQGNICRCTGYWNIVEAVVAASQGKTGMAEVEA